MVVSSVLHRKASGSKRCASSHSRMRAIIVDSSSLPRRISTTYSIVLLYSGARLSRVNAGMETTAAGRLEAAEPKPLYDLLGPLAVIGPHYGPRIRRLLG